MLLLVLLIAIDVLLVEVEEAGEEGEHLGPDLLHREARVLIQARHLKVRQLLQLAKGLQRAQVLELVAAEVDVGEAGAPGQVLQALAQPVVGQVQLQAAA